jgi:hypothetical protein
MKRALNGLPTGEPPIEISAEADAAMEALKELFSDPKIRNTASFRCCTEGPDELEVMFESVMEELFGEGEYKQWVKRLYDLGLIRRLPDEWK